MAERKLAERDYIIGANEREIDRLGIQHAVWRERAIAAWRRGGLKPGMTVLDMGSGPGHASFDLAAIVGPTGKVIAVDQSPIFLDALRRGAEARRLTNIETVECDLAELDLPDNSLDFVWTRWVLSFTPEPANILDRVAKALKPGGVFVAHEYGDYSNFRLHPMEPVMECFVAAVMESWREFGGDPFIGLELPRQFDRLGWTPRSFEPHVFAARPGDLAWRWPWNWLTESGIPRMLELGFITQEDEREFRDFLNRRAADPASLMITPMVLEAIATA